MTRTNITITIATTFVRKVTIAAICMIIVSNISPIIINVLLPLLFPLLSLIITPTTDITSISIGITEWLRCRL